MLRAAQLLNSTATKYTSIFELSEISIALNRMSIKLIAVDDVHCNLFYGLTMFVWFFVLCKLINWTKSPDQLQPICSTFMCVWSFYCRYARRTYNTIILFVFIFLSSWRSMFYPFIILFFIFIFENLCLSTRDWPTNAKPFAWLIHKQWIQFRICMNRCWSQLYILLTDFFVGFRHCSIHWEFLVYFLFVLFDLFRLFFLTWSKQKKIEGKPNHNAMMIWLHLFVTWKPSHRHHYDSNEFFTEHFSFFAPFNSTRRIHSTHLFSTPFFSLH